MNYLQKAALELALKVEGYSKIDRLQRLIELSVRFDYLKFWERLEHQMIQEIRQGNGEIQEVKKSRMHNEEF